MKKTLSLLVCLGITLLVIFNLNRISDFLADFLENEKKVSIASNNEYTKDYDFKFVQMSKNYVPYSYQGILNIIFSTLNNGWDSFTFYCPDEYTDCLKDVNKISNGDDKSLLSNINNFVHPYNSFEVINASYDNYGQVDLDIKKVYSDEDIKVLNDKVGKVIKSKINKKMSDKKRIEVIHDYIINNGKYATDKMRKKNPDKSYNKANDILIDHVGLCSAYADAMAIFLYEFGIDNYKIASTNHVWNLVKVNKKWLHLDLTWDDPITKTGVQKLEKIFLLIDNDELKELKVSQHKFNDNVYKEALN